MKIIAIEEHVSFPELNQTQGGPAARLMDKLSDITGERLRSMDENGITMEVLSVENTDVNTMEGQAAADFAARYNNLLADRIKDHPDRFAAFAHLPMTAPELAADELERTVQNYGFKGTMIRGHTNGDFLDHPKFAPVLARAEQLGVPIYIHPGLPPQSVKDAYYGNIGGEGYSDALACWGWGWHSETAIHVLRLLAAGTFDLYPKLKIIIGHMGEMLPMMWVRSNRGFQPGAGGKNQRTLQDTFKEQLYITTSGFFTQPPLQLALDTIGVDNIIFSVDYPFSTHEMGAEFLKQIPEDQVAKIAHRNAEGLLSL